MPSADDDIEKQFRMHATQDYFKVEKNRDNHLVWCPGKIIQGAGQRMTPAVTVVKYGIPKTGKNARGKDWWVCSKSIDKKPCYCHDTLIAKAMAMANSDPLRRKLVEMIEEGKTTYIQVADLQAGMAVSTFRAGSGLAKRIGGENSEFAAARGHHIFGRKTPEREDKSDWNRVVPFGFRMVELPDNRGIRYFKLPYESNEGSMGVNVLEEQYGVGLVSICRVLGYNANDILAEIKDKLIDLSKIRDVQPPENKWLDDTLAPFLGVSTKTQVQGHGAGPKRAAPPPVEDTLEEGGLYEEPEAEAPVAELEGESVTDSEPEAPETVSEPEPGVTDDPPFDAGELPEDVPLAEPEAPVDDPPQIPADDDPLPPPPDVDPNSSLDDMLAQTLGPGAEKPKATPAKKATAPAAPAKAAQAPVARPAAPRPTPTVPKTAVSRAALAPTPTAKTVAAKPVPSKK